MDCGLCAAQDETYRIIGGNDLAYCIIPIQALKPGHVMVLPRRHVDSLSDLIDTEARAFVRLADEMKNAVREAYPREDPVLLMNGGAHSTQPHIHWHVLPSKGGLRTLFAALEGMEERPQRSRAWEEEVRDHLAPFAKRYIRTF